MRAEQPILLAQINSQKGELQCLKEMIMNNRFSDKQEDEVRDLLHDNEVRNSPVFVLGLSPPTLLNGVRP